MISLLYTVITGISFYCIYRNTTVVEIRETFYGMGDIIFGIITFFEFV